MSDNSFSNLPPSGPRPADIPATERGLERVRVEIIRIPEVSAERDTGSERTIRGEVRSVDERTGRVTIETRRGDVEVQIPRSQTPPRPGTPVELRLPPPPQAPPQNASATGNLQLTATLVRLPPAPAINSQGTLPAQPLTDQVNLSQSVQPSLKSYPPPCG